MALLRRLGAAGCRDRGIVGKMRALLAQDRPHFGHVDFARLQINRDLDFIDMEGDVAIDMDGRAFGVDASVYYQARPDLAIGLVYRGSSSMKLWFSVPTR